MNEIRINILRNSQQKSAIFESKLFTLSTKAGFEPRTPASKFDSSLRYLDHYINFKFPSFSLVGTS